MAIKKEPLIHFPFFCENYLGKMAKYSYEEQGAFIRVVATYIKEDGQIAYRDDAHRDRLFSAFQESERQALVVVMDDAVDFAKTVMTAQKKLRKKNQENGKKGGRPVKLKVVDDKAKVN